MLAGYASGENGAREAARAGAAVIVVDAFRASTTIAAIASLGGRVVPVASIEEAASYPGADYRIGERGSAKVRGFDFGNSPTEVLAAGLRDGTTTVLSSTNGTHIVEAARGARDIYAGAFVNARAVAEYAAENAPEAGVYVVGCGWQGHRSSEDESACGLILKNLRNLGATLDERAERIIEAAAKRPERALRNNTAAKRLRRLGYEEDLDFCLKHDAVPVVPRLVDGAFVRQG